MPEYFEIGSLHLGKLHSIIYLRNECCNQIKPIIFEKDLFHGATIFLPSCSDSHSLRKAKCAKPLPRIAVKYNNSLET